MRAPLVSFVIPAFEQQDFIAIAVESALNQSHPNIEVVVINDGSSDETASIVSRMRDPRLKLINQSNAGPSVALNAGIGAAQGEFIALLGGDDIAEPWRAEYQLMLLDKWEVDAVLSQPAIIDELGEPLPDVLNGVFQQQPKDWTAASVLRLLASSGNFLCAPTVLQRRSGLLATGEFDPTIIQLQDYEHWLRWSSLGLTLRVGARPVTRYRRHRNNLSGGHRDVALRRELVATWDRMFDFGLPDLWRRAFDDVLDPRLDLHESLQPLEVVALYCAHPDGAARELGMRRVIEIMRSGRSILNVKEYQSLMNAAW